ncbi:MAG: hypothetical protein LBI10_00565 [Deltaproteobacteria bacterium]|nr:hypothetical protein [Deltaproteobacteria bacterium]
MVKRSGGAILIRGPPKSEPQNYYLTLTPKNPSPAVDSFEYLTFALEIGGLRKLKIWAKAESEGATFYAQTELVYYGRGASLAYGPGTLGPPPAWPTLSLRPPATFYRTTEEIAVALKDSPDLTAWGLWAVDPDLGQTDQILGPDYRYRFALDRNLAQKGLLATENVYLVQELTAGSLALTLPLYRSATAGRSYGAGLTLALSSVALGVMVGRLRRRP